MKNVVFLLMILSCNFSNDLFSQDSLIINNSNFKDSQSNSQVKLRTFKVYNLSIDSLTNRRLKDLICNCNSYITRYIMNGFTMRVINKEDVKVLILSPNISQIQMSNNNLDGVFFIDKIPFFIYNSNDMKSILSPTNRDIIVKYLEISNSIDEIILSNLIDEKFVSENTFTYKEIKYKLIIENCTKIKKKLANRSLTKF